MKKSRLLRGRKKTSIPLNKIVMKALLNKLLGWAQTWSHSKIGWLSNKAGLATAAVLAKMGLENDDQATQLIAAVVALVTIALELMVKVASDKFVGGIQKRFSSLKNDNWPGPATRGKILNGVIDTTNIE